MIAVAAADLAACASNRSWSVTWLGKAWSVRLNRSTRSWSSSSVVMELAEYTEMRLRCALRASFEETPAKQFLVNLRSAFDDFKNPGVAIKPGHGCVFM